MKINLPNSADHNVKLNTLEAAQIQFDWVTANVHRFEGDPKDIIAKAQEEFTRIRDQYEQIAESEALELLAKFK